MNNLDKVLLDLGDFAYVRSYGNLGDLLIAEGTEQYFARKGYVYSYLSPFEDPDKNINLVHGGGARFTKDWCDMDKCIRLLCNKHVKKCVILPSSFHDVDELLQKFDDRHTLFCRDTASYEYCRGLCPTSQVYLANDMAMQLNLGELKPYSLNGVVESDEEARLQHALTYYLTRGMNRGMCKASVKSFINGKKQKVAFLLRTDKEKKIGLNSPLTYDISLSWHTPPKNKYNANLLLAFSNVLKQVDVVISDRLHVCIMAYHSGCEVYMLDNTYGKLKGVYELTLKESERVHLIASDTLPADIQEAWRKLNCPLRVCLYNIYGKFKNAYKKAKKIIKAILKK